MISKIFLLTISERILRVHPLTQIDMIIMMWKNINLIKFQ